VGEGRVKGRQMAVGNIFLRASNTYVCNVSAHLLYSFWKNDRDFGLRGLFFEKRYLKIGQYLL
jgi:hypothetical protein